MNHKKIFISVGIGLFLILAYVLYTKSRHSVAAKASDQIQANANATADRIVAAGAQIATTIKTNPSNANTSETAQAASDQMTAVAQTAPSATPSASTQEAIVAHQNRTADKIQQAGSDIATAITSGTSPAQTAAVVQHITAQVANSVKTDGQRVAAQVDAGSFQATAAGQQTGGGGVLAKIGAIISAPFGSSSFSATAAGQQTGGGGAIISAPFGSSSFSATINPKTSFSVYALSNAYSKGLQLADTTKNLTPYMNPSTASKTNQGYYIENTGNQTITQMVVKISSGYDGIGIWTYTLQTEGQIVPGSEWNTIYPPLAGQVYIFSCQLIPGGAFIINTSQTNAGTVRILGISSGGGEIEIKDAVYV